MTRRSDMMLEDIFGCDHTPETPIVEDGEILYWLCRCGRRHPVRTKKSERAPMAEDVIRAALQRAVNDWRAAAQDGQPYDAERPVPDFFTLSTLSKHAGALAKDIAETRGDVRPIRAGLWELLPEQEPIPMRLFCEHCHAQHVDKGRFATHRHHTHTCQNCGLTWRPAKVFTVGVQFIPGFKDELGAPKATLAYAECCNCGGRFDTRERFLAHRPCGDRT